MTAVVATLNSTSAQAHAMDGLGVGLWHLVTDINHLLVLALAIVIASFTVRKGRQMRRAGHTGTN